MNNSKQSPYQIIKSRRLTEKTRVLENLQHSKSNVSVSRCQSPKAVFNVDAKANKTQIAWAVEQIYAAKKVKVVSVNTISIGPKPRKVRGFVGKTASLKKAVVTFRPGDQIEEQV